MLNNLSVGKAGSRRACTRARVCVYKRWMGDTGRGGLPVGTVTGR